MTDMPEEIDVNMMEFDGGYILSFGEEAIGNIGAKYIRSDIIDKEREAASKEHAKLTTMIEEFIEEDKEWHKIYAKMKAKLEAAEKMKEALRKIEWGQLRPFEWATSEELRGMAREALAAYERVEG